jgi:cell division protein FtsQ
LNLAILTRPAQGVITGQMQQNGTLPWEDDAPGDSRFRRTRQASSPARPPRRTSDISPGAPEDDENDLPRPRKRFKSQSRPWWRPTSKAGRIFLALGALAIVVAGVACWLTAKRYLERDARFRIAGTANIAATGLSEVSRTDMLPIFGEDIGKNIFFVNLSDRRKQLEQIPWIERASVMRLLPDQIRVNVIERTPIAFVRQGQQIGLVDADGILLSMPTAAMTQHHYSFPVVTGIDVGDPQPSRKARMAVYQRLVRDLDSTGQHLSDQISEIDLTDPEDARVLLPEQNRDILAHFGDDHFLDRYQRYKAHIAEWRQQYPHLSSVDMRYDQQVVLQMASGSEVTPGAQASTASSDGATSTAAPASAAKAPAKKTPLKPSKPAAHKDNRKHPAPRTVAGSAQTTATHSHAPKTWDE